MAGLACFEVVVLSDRLGAELGGLGDWLVRGGDGRMRVLVEVFEELVLV